MRVSNLIGRLNPLLYTRLRTKMLLAFTLVILIALIIVSAISYSVSVTSLSSSTAKYSAYIMEQLGKSLEEKAFELEERMFDIYKHVGVGPVLLEGVDDRDRAKEIEKRRIVGHFLLQLINTFPKAEFVYLYDLSGERYHYNNRNVPNGQWQDSPEPPADASLLQAYRGQVLWEAWSEDIIYLQRALYDIDTSQYCGYLVFGLNNGFLKEEYAKFEALNYGRVIVLNERDEPLLYRSTHEQEEAAVRLAEIGDLSQTTMEGERYMASVEVSGNKRWKLVNLVALRDITAPASLIRLWIAAAFLAAFIAAMALTYIFSGYITSNLRMFVRSMKRVSEGIFEQVQPPRGRDEIVVLAEKFNLMSDKIKDLIDKIYEEQAQKRQAEYRTLQFEFKALQAQINPHFLYNTLEAIQGLAIVRGEKEIGRMIFLLASLFEETVRTGSDFVPLREELAYISKYLEIQQMIYDGKLAVDYEIDETLLDCQVPKLILQPIVENAIMHGIEKKPGMGHIRIRCAQEGGIVVLQIEDNGIGMAPMVVERLTQIGEEERESAHVGIRSVHKRVRILYGEVFGLTISSEEGKGTAICILLPGGARER